MRADFPLNYCTIKLVQYYISSIPGTKCINGRYNCDANVIIIS